MWAEKQGLLTANNNRLKPWFNESRLDPGHLPRAVTERSRTIRYPILIGPAHHKGTSQSLISFSTN